MKCLLKRPPLHICKSHLPLSSNCGSRVFLELCNAIFYKCSRTSLTFVNSLFTFYSPLDLVSLWPLRYGFSSPDGWGWSQLRLKPPRAVLLPQCHHSGISQNWPSKSCVSFYSTECDWIFIRDTGLIITQHCDLLAVDSSVGEMQRLIGRDKWSEWTISVKRQATLPWAYWKICSMQSVVALMVWPESEFTQYLHVQENPSGSGCKVKLILGIQAFSFMIRTDDNERCSPPPVWCASHYC